MDGGSCFGWDVLLLLLLVVVGDGGVMLSARARARTLTRSLPHTKPPGSSHYLSS